MEFLKAIHHYKAIIRAQSGYHTKKTTQGQMICGRQDEAIKDLGESESATVANSASVWMRF